MDWFKEKIIGTSHISWENLWFPADFPMKVVNPFGLLHASPVPPLRHSDPALGARRAGGAHHCGGQRQFDAGLEAGAEENLGEMVGEMMGEIHEVSDIIGKYQGNILG